jgi:hypothetical protein
MRHCLLPQRQSPSRVRRRLRMVVLASALALVGSCDGAEHTLTGAWIGFDGERRVLLSLKESDGAITGSGTIRRPDGTIEVDGGSHVGPDVQLAFSIEYSGGYSFGSATGVLDGDRIVARLADLAFTTDTITLLRWP